MLKIRLRAHPAHHLSDAAPAKKKNIVFYLSCLATWPFGTLCRIQPRQRSHLTTLPKIKTAPGLFFFLVTLDLICSDMTWPFQPVTWQQKFSAKHDNNCIRECNYLFLIPGVVVFLPPAWQRSSATISTWAIRARRALNQLISISWTWCMDSDDTKCIQKNNRGHVNTMFE